MLVDAAEQRSHRVALASACAHQPCPAARPRPAFCLLAGGCGRAFGEHALWCWFLDPCLHTHRLIPQCRCPSRVPGLGNVGEQNEACPERDSSPLEKMHIIRAIPLQSGGALSTRHSGHRTLVPAAPTQRLSYTYGNRRERNVS